MIFDFVKDEFNKYYYNKYNLKNRIHYSVMQPRRGTVTVVVTTEDNVSYDCIYKYMEKEDIYAMIENGEPLNLDRIYVKDFDITEIEKHEDYQLFDFSASYSFWDGHANFDHALFSSGDIHFDHATFGDGDANFYNTKFSEGTIDFEHTNFGVGEVNFNYASFGDGDVCFRQAHFGFGNVLFYGTDFGKGIVNFDGASLEGVEIDFVNVKAERMLFMQNEFLSHTDMVFASVEELTVQDCIVEKILNCKSETGFKRMSFYNTSNLGIIYLDWRKSGAQRAIENGHLYVRDGSDYQKNEFSADELAAQFRILKENYRKIGDYEDEDDAYRAFMKYKNKAFPKNLIKLFGLVGGYGTRPLRVLLSSLATILLFGLGYTHVFTLSPSGEVFSNVFFKGLYFSAVTFLTIGYGDIQPPTQAIAFVASVEGFLGLFLMSYFTVAIVRKLLR